MAKRKILILIPGRNARGGVNYYFSSIRKYLTCDIDFFYRGARNYPYHENYIKQIARIIFDYINFIFKVLFNNYKLININTTLDKRGILRDGLFVILSIILLRKVVVFYRGWDTKIEHGFNYKYLKIFKYFFLKSNAAIVLGTEFRQKLYSWGYKNPVYVETTTVDENLIKDLKISKIVNDRIKKLNHANILYLSRMEKEKGIFLCVDAFRLLKNKFPDIVLTFAGDGHDLENLKEHIKKEKIDNVYIKGYVFNEKKRNAYEEANIFLLPTAYKEGLPNAVLEAMAFGLPVITSSVGGLKDVVINNKNGYVLRHLMPEHIAEKIENLLLNKELYREISYNNYKYAQNKFRSDIVARRLETIYKEII